MSFSEQRVKARLCVTPMKPAFWTIWLESSISAFGAAGGQPGSGRFIQEPEQLALDRPY
jgi:hypothetical protein